MPEGTALESFQDWTERYLTAAAHEKPDLEEKGRILAQQRRPVFKDLITSDPQRALMQAVPMVVRQKLPLSVVALLEERIAVRGVLRQYWRAPEPGNEEPPVVRYVEAEDGRTLEAFVYGRRAQEPGWVMNASLNGVAMDGQFAVNESPLRRLEQGEVADPRKKAVEVCPVSGNVTAAVPSGEPVTEWTPVVEVYDEIIYLCDGAHIVPYEQSLIQGESSTGGAQGFTGILPSAPTPSVGVVKVLCIPAVFADQGQVPASEATMLNMLKETGDFYQTTSYGRLTLQATVIPPVVLPRNQAWYKGKDTTDGYIKEIDGLGQEMAHAKEEARKLGYDWQDYHATIVRANGGARSPTSFGSVGGGNVWMRSDSISTCSHEIGHAFGLTHANFWQTNGSSIIGPGGNVEYGHSYDNMGSTSPPNGHWNVQAKNQVKWLPDEFSPAISRSGLYRIHAFDTARLEPGLRYGLRITKDANRSYWGEHRTLFSTNNWASNGLLLGWKWAANSGGNLQLLDTTPGSPNDRTDAAISLGRTFSDNEAGIHITTLAVNPETTPRSVDVQVNFGLYPGNQPPAVSLAASSTVVPLNTPVTFTATAEDPDGDALSYGWIWHDNTISPNQSEVIRTFSVSGIYTLNCVVSDMKGGSTIRNAVITVGTGGGRFTISGRITKEGSGLKGINVSTSGTNGTLTDSDGFYTISNLNAGTYTITPAQHGSVFNELFNNTVTVGPSFSGADFTVDELPVVNITAPDALASETGDPGVFRISRTGSTALPMTVYVFPVQGTAVKTTDYTLSPDYVAVTNTPWQTFTVPADADYLDVTLSPVNDSTQEGYETVTLVLGQDASFSPGSSLAATIGIEDDDTPRPRLSLSASRDQVNEQDGEPVVCTVTRTGSTAASLDVSITVAGSSTATAGEDYHSLPGTVTIPAGAESATFEFIPLNDSLSEVTETVRLTIVTNAAFMADSAASQVVLRIVDDDTQVVTLIATDDVATEVDLTLPGAVADPGTFLLTRSGDVSAPLTVYYSAAGSALHGTDYEALAGRVEFAAGETRAAITILPLMDGFGEAAETVVLSLAAGNGNYLLGDSFSGAVIIHDLGGAPVLEVAASSGIAAEPSTNGTFRITAKGTGTGSLTVRYTISGTATAGTDYTISGLNTTTLEGSTTVTLNNATATRDITVTVLNDSALEEMETVVLTLLPDPAYSLWGPNSSTTLLLRDDDQPTVFVDPQVGNTGAHFVAESATGTACDFWISRTGSTASELTVNYSMTGTATNGVDYTLLSGVAVIPAGAPGIDVTLNTINDSLFEGTETAILHLEPGSYARGPDATLYITDNETGGPAVSFASSGGSGLESLTEVGIPVKLSAAAAEPVTVEYSLEAGARSTTIMSGQWLRIVKTGTSFETFVSPDGITFTKTGLTRSLSGFPSNYLAGLVVSSGSTSVQAAVEFDQVSVTGLSVGGSAGARISTDLAGASPPGVTSESDGIYRVVAGGPDLTTSGTTDGGHMVYFPVTNSANCTVTARLLSSTCTSSTIKPGVIIRETTSTSSRRMAFIQETNGYTRQIYRVSNGGTSTSSFIPKTFTKPVWLRLQREGEVIRTFTSTNGSSFVPHGGGLTVPLGSNVLVGLAASARSDGLLAQAFFDNVSLTPAPAQPLEGRALGYVNEPGGVKQNGGAYVITASGNGIMPALSSTEDEGHFLSAPVSGDFTLTAKLTGIEGGGTTPQAGLMVRDSINRRGRTLYFGLTGSGTSAMEYRARLSATTSGEGSGIDYTLPPGVLTFAPGETEKTIPLLITNDQVAEPDETVNVLLSYPHRAMLGTPATYTYTVMDDDGPLTSLPVIGFASAVSSGTEDHSPADIPVILSRASAEVVTIGYATTAGGTASATTDYTPISGTLTFQPGETVKVISLPILNDAVAELVETVNLLLSAPAGAILSSTSAHTHTILDDDLPVVTLQATDASATEGGDTGAFTFYRTGSTASPLTVQFSRSGSATSGSDFTAFPSASSFTIPAGSASADLLVNTIQNSTPEIDETVIVTLASGSGYVVGTPASASVIIQDDDVNTITLVATDGVASEVGNDAGELVLTRTGPLTAARQVNLSITGTAASGVDYIAIGGSRTFAIGESSISIPVTAIQDELTEGDEVVVVSITANSSYITGSPSVANVVIVDDDLPPSVFISSPASKATIIAEGNGLMLEAVGMDDGLPSPLTYTWSRLFGPGTVTFENASAASTGVSFSAPGVHGLRITVDDGQFTASDVIFVEAGGFAYANWVSQDQGPPSVRGVAGESDNGFTLVGSGTGYSGTNDSGHMLFRQLSSGSGDAAMIVRLNSLSGPATRLAGITLRDTSWKGARRVNLVVDGSGTVQFRSRSTANTADTASTQAGSSLPLWLRLERVGSTLTAATAPDVDGTPGSWTEAGSTSAVSMGANVVVGMVVSSGASTTATSTAMFDHVSVTPPFSGPALHSEDIGNYSLPGSSSVNGSITTVNGIGTYDNGGHFRYQQVWGDCMITARLLTQTGATRGSQAGVGLRDTTDNGPHGFYGRTSIDGFQAHWRSVPAGTASTLQTGGAIGSWVRLVRKGNSISAFRASDAGGAPGAWAQVTGNLPAALSGPLLVGLVVDSNSPSLTGTGTFSGLTIEPLNTAPVIVAGTAPSGPDYLLSASVTDDGKPNPPGAYSLAWSNLGVPDQVIFSQPTGPVSQATPTRSGDYAVRLTADDGDARTYLDIAFAATIPAYQTWLHEHQLFAHPLAGEMDDADYDGLLNILEYAMNLPGNIPGTSPVSYDWAEVDGLHYLRISIPKNPDATNMRFEAQATSDLGSPSSWTSDGLVIESNSPTLLRVRDYVPLSDGGRRFMRVRVWMEP
ncbi:Calx-beta domain-containing protein [Prosthecobacter sp. SYSU 5D2]|uniref:Calx-beta domain-containing protein n=1 Tax=Prosthecobacter sp. SYSU 5D2 TaxID=3134134 RepID=UPI0031FEF615